MSFIKSFPDRRIVTKNTGKETCVNRKEALSYAAGAVSAHGEQQR